NDVQVVREYQRDNSWTDAYRPKTDAAGTRRHYERCRLTDPFAKPLPVCRELRLPTNFGISRHVQQVRFVVCSTLTGGLHMLIDPRAQIERRHTQLAEIGDSETNQRVDHRKRL